MQYVKCLFGFCLVLESDESYDDDSKESFDDEEDEESDEISINYRAIWTRSFSVTCYIEALQLVNIQELVSSYSYKRPFHVVSFVPLLILVLP